MIRAAGILFTTRDGQALFVRRAPDGDHGGEWCIPGGKLEDGETPEVAARREAAEEAGPSVPEGPLKRISRTLSAQGPTDVPLDGDASTLVVPEDQVDFTTFVQIVDAPFPVVESDETTAHAWAPISDPPQPLHPGVVTSLACMTANELDLARMMAAGQITSPQRYENVALFDIRITGTGVAYRKPLDEYVYRAPENYLTPDFLQRCNGLPVLWEHPAKATLDHKEWGDRVVGTTFLPYIKGDEVWAIVKIYDAGAIAEMEQGNLSTSPTVVIRDADSTKFRQQDGSVLLFEGKPGLLDHIAICEAGVWDKGGAPAGVNARADAVMTEEEKLAADKARKDAEAAEAKKADASGTEKLDSFMSAMSGFMDSMGKRMDSFEDRFKKADADEETRMSNEAASTPVAGDPAEAEAKDGTTAEARGDAARKDAKKADETEEERKEREGREKAARDDAAKVARADAAATQAGAERIASLEKQLLALSAKMPKQISDADYMAMADVQARADSVYNSLGHRQAPRPLDGETKLAYRRRLATELKAHSASWKAVDLTAFADEAGFAVAEKQIYADAEVTARNPIMIPEGELRRIVRKTDAGGVMHEYVGQPRDWMSDFTSVKSRATLNTGTRA